MRRLLLPFFLCAASCSDASPLDPATLLNAMSDEEAREVCEYRADAYRAVRGSPRDRCMSRAVRENSSADCEAALRACLRAGEGEIPMLGGAAGQAMQALEKSLFDCSDASAAAWSNCDATFGEYKACLDAEFAEHLKYWDSLSCEQHGAAAPVLTLTPRSPQCQALFERCASE